MTTRFFVFGIDPRALVMAAIAGTAAFVLGGDVLPAPQAKAAAIIVATIGLWATGPIPEALTALGFFAAAILFKVAPTETILSGLISSAFWMVFSGIVIGMAIKATGLSARIADLLAALLGRSQASILAGVTVFGVVLAFLMPSAMGRVVLIVPVLADLVARLGLAKEDKFSSGVMLAGILGTSLPSTAIYPANIPNNVMGGIFENLFHQRISYSDYLIDYFPLFGIAKTALLILVLIHFHAGKGEGVANRKASHRPPLAPAERRLVVYLGAAMALWMTDAIHGIPPAWVGLLVAIVCLAPGIGVLPAKALQSVNLEPLIYVSGVVGLGAVISSSGLGHQVALWAKTLLPVSRAGGMQEFLSLCGLSTLVGVAITLPGVPAVLTPLTGEFSAMTNLPPATVLATQVAGFSTLLLPYQAPPLVAALQLGGLSRWEMSRVTLILALVSVVALWPLSFLWLGSALAAG